MTEKISIKGKDIWISIEVHTRQQPGYYDEEYFTASYQAAAPASNVPGILFEEKKNKPMEFHSPVEALEYAEEKLLGLI